jgi:hypothetical protein
MDGSIGFITINPGHRWLAMELEKQEDHDPYRYTESALRCIGDARRFHGDAAGLYLNLIFAEFRDLARQVAAEFDHDVTPAKYRRNAALWLDLSGPDAHDSWLMRAPRERSEWLDICRACRACKRALGAS